MTASLDGWPWIFTGLVEVAVDGVDVLAGAGSEIGEVLADAQQTGQGGFFAEVITGNGLALAEILRDVGGERSETDLLRVALHATIGGVDFMTRDGEAGDRGRKHAAGGFIGNGLKVSEIFQRIVDESEPSGAEDQEDA